MNRAKSRQREVPGQEMKKAEEVALFGLFVLSQNSLMPV